MEMPAEEEVKESSRGFIDYRLDEQKVKALEQLEQEIRKENEAKAHKPDDVVFKVPDLPPLKTSKSKKPALLHQASSRQLKKQKSIDEDERPDVVKHKVDNDGEEGDDDDDKSVAKKAKLDQIEPTTSKPYKDDTVEEKAPTTAKTANNTDKKDNGPTKSDSKTTDKRKFDGLEDSLMCSICNDIMHDCISLQPCLHSYCSGCYSEWMDMSDDCPICRVKVTRISKSHMLNNLIETFLKNNPDMRRPEADIRDLDSKNKITHDMVSGRFPSFSFFQTINSSLWIDSSCIRKKTEPKMTTTSSTRTPRRNMKENTATTKKTRTTTMAQLMFQCQLLLFTSTRQLVFRCSTWLPLLIISHSDLPVDSALKTA